MSELIISKISQNKYSRNSRKGRRSKNKFQIELGKTVSPSNNIVLNNFNETSKSIKTSPEQKPILKQARLDKYFRKDLKDRLDKQRHKKYYKSPKKRISPSRSKINNIPNKKTGITKFNKITIKVNRNYYINSKDKLFNPNILKDTTSNFDNMPSEDIYLCNSISQKVTINRSL